MVFKELLREIDEYCKNTNTPLEYMEDEKTKIYNTHGLVIISKSVIKRIWSLSYISLLHYNSFMTEIKPCTPKLNPNIHHNVFELILEKRRQIEFFHKTEKENASAPWEIPPEPIGEIINPSYQPYINPKEYYLTNQICSYAILFWLLHEVGHNICPIPSPEKKEYGKKTNYSEHEKKIFQDIEIWCDNYAFDEYKKIYLTKIKSSGRINCAKIAIQIAMLFFLTKSFDTQEFDGDEHPEIYKRIYNIMSPISSEDDISWALLNAFLSFEFKDIHSIKINQNLKFKTHKAVVNYFLNLIEKYDTEQCKTKISTKKNLYLASDYGVWRKTYYDEKKGRKELVAIFADNYWYYYFEWLRILIFYLTNNPNNCFLFFPSRLNILGDPKIYDLSTRPKIQ